MYSRIPPGQGKIAPSSKGCVWFESPMDYLPRMSIFHHEISGGTSESGLITAMRSFINCQAGFNVCVAGNIGLEHELAVLEMKNGVSLTLKNKPSASIEADVLLATGSHEALAAIGQAVVEKGVRRAEMRVGMVLPAGITASIVLYQHAVSDVSPLFDTLSREAGLSAWAW